MKQKGGDQNKVISASVDMIKSMKELGQSIFNEITAITHIQSDINNGVTVQQPINHNNNSIQQSFKLPKKL